MGFERKSGAFKNLTAESGHDGHKGCGLTKASCWAFPQPHIEPMMINTGAPEKELCTGSACDPPSYSEGGSGFVGFKQALCENLGGNNAWVGRTFKRRSEPVGWEGKGTDAGGDSVAGSDGVAGI